MTSNGKSIFPSRLWILSCTLAKLFPNIFRWCLMGGNAKIIHIITSFFVLASRFTSMPGDLLKIHFAPSQKFRSRPLNAVHGEIMIGMKIVFDQGLWGLFGGLHCRIVSHPSFNHRPQSLAKFPSLSYQRHTPQDSKMGPFNVSKTDDRLLDYFSFFPQVPWKTFCSLFVLIRFWFLLCTLVLSLSLFLTQFLAFSWATFSLHESKSFFADQKSISKIELKEKWFEIFLIFLLKWG